MEKTVSGKKIKNKKFKEAIAIDCNELRREISMTTEQFQEGMFYSNSILFYLNQISIIVLFKKLNRTG